MGLFDFSKRKSNSKQNDFQLIIRDNKEHMCNDYILQNPNRLSLTLNYTRFGQTPGKVQEGQEIIGFSVEESGGDINIEADEWGYVFSYFKTVSYSENKDRLSGDEILVCKHFSDESLFKSFISKQITF